MEISLTNSDQKVLVSFDDYSKLLKYKWWFNTCGYVVANIKNKIIKIHRFIMKPHENEVVDHINGNKLDNRKENLRNTTTLKNTQNRRISKSKTSSIYKGVYFKKKMKKYQSGIIIEGTYNHLGSYKDEKKAAESVDIFIVHNKLDHIALNFPDKKDEYLKINYEKYKSKQTKTSKYLGVIKKENGKFITIIKIKGKKIQISIKDNEIEAAKSYDEYIINNNIPKKKLNFPNDYPNYNPDYIKTPCEEIDSSTVKLIIKNKEINLIIDKNDYNKVKYYNCYINKKGYGVISIQRKAYLLHRFIMNEKNPLVYIDHIDNNKLNNTKKNLRLSNPQKNGQNKSKKKLTTSTYLGVCFDKDTNSWRFSIKKNGKNIYSERNKNEYYAAIKRDLYILENLKDDHYKLNFEWNLDKINEWKNKLNV